LNLILPVASEIGRVLFVVPTQIVDGLSMTRSFQSLQQQVRVKLFIALQKLCVL
jgi:hypothetical protein